MKPKQRCPWPNKNPLMVKYHDEEWGVPLHDDQKIFEFLILEGAQAGLSWSTILKKRENYRQAFDGFDAVKIAEYGEDDFDRLMENVGIVRNRLKIRATIGNARAFLEIVKEFGSSDKYIWSFVDGKVKKNEFKSMKGIPANTEESDNMSKDLKKRGFKFVGTTICYAFMQAVGMVNDHQIDCFRYKEV